MYMKYGIIQMFLCVMILEDNITIYCVMHVGGQRAQP